MPQYITYYTQKNAKCQNNEFICILTKLKNKKIRKFNEK